MKNKEIEHYKKIHELATEITMVVLENKESQNVNEYFTDERNYNQMQKRLENAHEINEIYLEVENRDKERDIHRLMLKMRYAEENRIKRRRFAYGIISSSVAAAVAIISFLLYDGRQETIVSVDVPKYTKMTTTEGVKIIHANGNEEILDTKKRIAINGIDVAQVDGSRIKYSHTAAIDSVELSTIVIPKASRYTVVLEDGTEICLTANSTLKYPSKFVGESRDVELTGEAYFKVTKDNRPFNVKVLELNVRVYGTEFMINSYNRNRVETTLFSGSVGVKYNANNSSHEIKISPDQRLTIDSDNGSAKLDKNINRQKCLSWRDGFFRSDEEPLEELLEDIGNWFDVQFIYKDPSIGAKLVSASLDSKMSIESLIKMLELSTKITIIKEEGGKYIVK